MNFVTHSLNFVGVSSDRKNPKKNPIFFPKFQKQKNLYT
jgi:hypothetical protein